MKKYLITHSQQIKLTKPGKYLIQLIKPHTEVRVTGCFKTVASEHFTIELVVQHSAADTQANIVLKGVADDQSQLKFAGKIIIDQNCPQANSFLTERILLLSDQAIAETVPDLEILSADVVCSHAASISSVSEEQLFYLMSRGLSEKHAKKLIVTGFLQQL